jgi:hypothetical protein
LCFLCDDARFCHHRRSPGFADFHDSFSPAYKGGLWFVPFCQ